MLAQKQKPSVRKPTATIHIENQFTFIERKLLNSLIFHAQNKNNKLDGTKKSLRNLVTIIEMKYMASKNQKAFMADLKPVYKDLTKDDAEAALDELESRWGSLYPIVINFWRNKWENLSMYFKYPKDIRRVIYTINAIESIHRQFRKLTKTKGAFPKENSLLQLLYVGIQNDSKKWTMPIHN